MAMHPRVIAVHTAIRTYTANAADSIVGNNKADLASGRSALLFGIVSIGSSYAGRTILEF